MSIVVNRSFPGPRYRYDVINGVRTGPFLDGNYEITRNVRTTDPNKTTNFGRYVSNGWWKPENYYKLQHEKAAMPNGPAHLKVIWIPTGDYSEYYGSGTAGYGDITYLGPTAADRTYIAGLLSRKLLGKIKGQKVNLGVFLAERQQTLSLFGETATRLAKACQALRRKRYKEAFKALRCPPNKNVNASRSLADNWLQLQYGWLPLLGDCFGAAEELEQAFDKTKKNPPKFRVSANNRLQRQDAKQSVNYPGASADRAFILDSRYQCYYTVDVGASQWLGRVGLTNPFDIAWEKLPWSFVVDWFLPVGKFLNTLDATLGCSYVSGSQASSMYQHIDWRLVSTYTVGNYKYEWACSSVHARYFTYERASLGGFPAVTLPQLKNPLSAQHCANALALLRQAFRK